MLRLKFSTTASISLLAILCMMAVPLYVFSQYRVDDHKWFYSKKILDLPARDDNFLNSRRHDFDGWTPGSPKWLVDPKEYHSKFPKNVTFIGRHEILYYNRRPASRLEYDYRLLEVCPAKNCHFTDDEKLFETSSAIIFEISHQPMAFPSKTRPLGQIWVFNDFEPPLINTKFTHRHKRWNSKMNWSMTYRYDSDIIRNFGFLKTRSPDKIPQTDYHNVFTSKNRFAAWFVSNCGSMTMSARNEYVNELKKYIPIDIYGKCGTLFAERKYEPVKEILKDYKFFLSFENSFCTDVTEKFFQFFNITDAILVVRGGADYDQLLPEYTHINSQHFANARDLAQYMLTLNQSESEYIEYLKTRNKYDVVQMNWACNLCLKLNDKKSHAKVYPDLVKWWHTDKCWAATDVYILWTAKRKWFVIMLVIVCVVFSVLIYTKQPFSNFLCPR